MDTFEILKDYSTILFDWDGCLAKTLQNWLRAYTETYTKYNVEFNESDILCHSWGNLEEGPKYFGIKNYDDVWVEIVNLVTVYNSKVDLYAGAKSLIQKLKDHNIKIAIVTSSEMKIIKPALEYNKLSFMIDGVFTEEMVSQPKPNAEIVNFAIKSLNSDRKSTIIVGDTAKDIIAGQNGEIDTMLILHKENKRFYDFNKIKLSNPNFIVNKF